MLKIANAFLAGSPCRSSGSSEFPFPFSLLSFFSEAAPDNRQSQHESSENTFAVTLAANQNKEQSTMNKLEIKGDWNITKGKLKQKWAKLTDDDLQYVEGKHEELFGRIQKRTGETREAVEKAMKEFFAASR